jgi:hypothetical protein
MVAESINNRHCHVLGSAARCISAYEDAGGDGYKTVGIDLFLLQ